MQRSVPFAALLLAMSTAASAQSPAMEIADVRQLILYARYDEAIEQAQALLQRTLDAQSRNVALEVLATAHIANRDEGNAAAVLEQLYSRDPGHRLSDPDASPLVQAAFQRARERHPTTVNVRLEHSPPVLRQRESPLIEVRVAEGGGAVGEVRLAYRTGGAPRFARLVMNVDEDGVARGRIPLVGNPERDQEIQYFIVALAPSMTPLGQEGDEAEPLSLTVPGQVGALTEDPVEDPITEPAESSSKWWVGVLVGVVVVVAAVVGGYFLFREEAPDGTLGNASLR